MLHIRIRSFFFFLNGIKKFIEHYNNYPVFEGFIEIPCETIWIWWFLCMMHACLSCFSHVRLFVISWTVACQSPLSMGFSRQEYSSGLPFPPPGDLPNPGTEPTSLAFPALASGFFVSSATWEVHFRSLITVILLLKLFCCFLYLMRSILLTWFSPGNYLCFFFSMSSHDLWINLQSNLMI